MGYTLIVANTWNNVGNQTLLRAWGSSIANAFANSGWVKCTDVVAGTQIDWSGVTTANTTVVSKGYEIWEMGDALQATAPVFLKVEYGGSQASPYLWFTVGTGANASGNVTGNVSYRINVTTSNSVSGQSYFAGGTSRFAWVGLGTGRTSTMLFGVERTVDANGTPTGDGVLFLWNEANFTASQFAWTPALSNTAALETTWGMMTSTVNGAISLTMPPLRQIPFYPIFHTMPGTFFNPGLNFVGSLSALMTNSMTAQGTLPPVGEWGKLQIQYYGNTHTYLPLSSGYIYPYTYRNVGNAISLMMRWE